MSKKDYYSLSTGDPLFVFQLVRMRVSELFWIDSTYNIIRNNIKNPILDPLSIKIKNLEKECHETLDMLNDNLISLIRDRLIEMKIPNLIFDECESSSVRVKFSGTKFVAYVYVPYVTPLDESCFAGITLKVLYNGKYINHSDKNLGENYEYNTNKVKYQDVYFHQPSFLLFSGAP